MSDEPAKLILGDTVISALEEHPDGKRGFFGRRRRQRTPLAHCENCGTPLTGRYCAQCGQPAIDYRRSFRHVIVDVLDSFLNWDSKFFATIGLLIAKPWRLTNEFLAGKRVHYLHPLRLYLLASILFFLGVNQLAKSAHIPTRSNVKREELPPEAKAKLDAAMEKLPSSKKEEFFQITDKDDSSKNAFEKWIKARAKEKFGENGANAQAFLITLINNLPGMMLCCIPLFAFVLKILYLRRHIFYIDHLIYALHIHTFAYVGIMLIGFATMGLNRIAPNLVGWVSAVLWTTFAVQIFLSIRRVYKQGWFFSLIKFCFGGVAYLMVLSIALLATFLVTLALP